MKFIVLFQVFCFWMTAAVFGQAVPQEDPEKAAEQKIQTDVNRRVENLRNIGKTQIIRDRYKDSNTYTEIIKPRYRELNQEELKLISPDPKFSEEYADFLKQKGSGLIKLIIDRGCDERAEIVVSKPHCLKYNMPGAGASFSFRANSHRIKRLSDITFEDNKFVSEGTLTQGIFVNLGQVNLDDLNLQSAGINVLTGFEPPEMLDQVKKLSFQLKSGIRDEKFLYSSGVKIKNKDTYALRSIAYRGNAFQTVREITYDEFEFDKRKDIIVAFKILEADDETVTIVWKELEDKKSPTLKSGN